MHTNFRALVVAAALALLASFPVSAQTKAAGPTKAVRNERRPAADVPATPANSKRVQSADDSGAVFLLDGVPMSLALHHDTEVGTNKPVDVWVLVIEMQIMNSDGDLEPEGLDIFNFFTKSPREARHDVNPHNAHDCKLWTGLVTDAMRTRDPKSKTWPYIEFQTAVGARVVQTNEDGAVWWSDDVECWGSSDRFPPF